MLPHRLIMDKSEDEIEFELAIQNVPLASSIRLALRRTGVRASPAAPCSAPELAPNASSKSDKTRRKGWAALTSEEKNIYTNIIFATLLLAFAVCRGGLQLAVLRQQNGAILGNLSSVSADSLVMAGLGLLLLLYNGLQLRGRSTSKQASGSSAPSAAVAGEGAVRASVNVQLTLLGHSLKSPDAPVVELDDGSLAYSCC